MHTPPEHDRDNGYTGDVLAVALYLAAVVLIALVAVAAVMALHAPAHNAPARMDTHTPAR